MKGHVLRTIIYCGVMLWANGASVSFIKKCKVDDPDCILQSTREAIPFVVAGIPDIGVKPLDPVHVKKIDASSGNLQLILKDVYFKGLKNCVPKKVEFQDIASTPGKLYIKAVCSVDLNAAYEMKGVLIVPIEGSGNVNASLPDTTYKVHCNLDDKIGSDGKLYLNVKSCTTTAEYKPYVKIYFDNLFPNNEVLAKAAHEVIEGNSDVVMSEMSPPIEKAIIDVIVKNIKILIGSVPAEDLIL